MKWTVWDKLIVIIDEETKKIVLAKLLYHFENENISYEKTIENKAVELVTRRLAKHKKIPLSKLKESKFLEIRSMQNEKGIIREELKEEKRRKKIEESYQKSELKISNLKVDIDKETFKKKGSFCVAKLIPRDFVGYKKIDTSLPKSSLFTYHSLNGVGNVSREVMNSYGKIEQIIYYLVSEQYEKLDNDDISFVKSYFEWISRINNNQSDAFFSYSLFNLISKGLYNGEARVLKNVEELYNDIHVQDEFSDKYLYDTFKAKKYLLYVMTLVSGGENTLVFKEENRNDVASFEDAYEFNKMSEIGKLYILLNIKDVIIRNTLDFDKFEYNIHSFNTKEFYKKRFCDELDEKINNVILKLKRKIQNNIK